MKAIETLFPVFFMMLLGYLARKRNWLSREQNEGAKKLIFTVLFPMMIFHVLATSELSSRFVILIVAMDIIWFIIYILGKKLAWFTGEKFAHISPYLLLTCEGGSVALPLYLTLMKQSDAVNIVTFDVAGILINFILIPLLITRQKSDKVDVATLVKNIGSSSFLIAVLLGGLFQFTGLYRLLMNSQFGGIYTNTMDVVIQPITGIILFTLGYDLQFKKDMFQPLIRLTIVRIVFNLGIIAIFMLIFPGYMQEHAFMTAVLLYFMCPTGFPVPLQVQPLVKNEEDENFMSAFISVFMVIALITYALLAVLIL
ncbi:MAG: AEC family transporter [Erysipelotrichaceae bacterium]|nr:AEC family transporter [Erysipelotrichaceae bacterium]